MGDFLYLVERSIGSENIDMNTSAQKESVVKTWLVVFLCLGIILAKGFFAFFAVGDLGMPRWDYQAVKDIPGESPQAVYESLPYPQHVLGRQGK
jgi:hypothetical protein